MADGPPTDKRRCLYVDETMSTPNGYIPAAVFEDTSGYWPMIGSGEFSEPWYFGKDIATAKQLVEESNRKMGITPEDALAIVASSLAASLREDAARQRAEERMERLRKGQSPWPPTG